MVINKLGLGQAEICQHVYLLLYNCTCIYHLICVIVNSAMMRHNLRSLFVIRFEHEELTTMNHQPVSAILNNI